MLSFIIIIITILLSAQLWRMGGNGNRAWRFIGVPTVIALGKILISLSYGWWLLIMSLYAPVLWGMLSLFGYGLNSLIHKLVVDIADTGSDGNNKLVEVATRAICGFGWSLAGIVFVLLTGNWDLFFGYTLFLTMHCGLVGGLVKDVEISERVVGGALALAILL